MSANDTAADLRADMCDEIFDDPRERFDEYDDPFFQEPPNCYGTSGSFDCEFTRCQHRRTCYITYDAKRKRGRQCGSTSSARYRA